MNTISGDPTSPRDAKDLTKFNLPRKENRELAEDLLARFSCDRAELLKSLVASIFFDMRHGNKREERAACDYLNEVQRIALNMSTKPNKS